MCTYIIKFVAFVIDMYVHIVSETIGMVGKNSKLEVSEVIYKNVTTAVLIYVNASIIYFTTCL